MMLYAVALSRDGEEWWIEFYSADDSDHAREQAEDANPYAEILAIATVPA